MLAPALIAVSTARQRKSGSLRVASSADHSTSGHRFRASPTECAIASSTASGARLSFTRMCSGEVAMKVWMRGRCAPFSAAHARSMSPAAARARLATVARWHWRATSRTASKSPSLAMAKPASMMSTPSASSWAATRSFSSRFMEQPGDCSPSRRVVSKIRMWSLTGSPSVAEAKPEEPSCPRRLRRSDARLGASKSKDSHLVLLAKPFTDVDAPCPCPPSGSTAEKRS